jgi:hypothetical protein
LKRSLKAIQKAYKGLFKGLQTPLKYLSRAFQRAFKGFQGPLKGFQTAFKRPSKKSFTGLLKAFKALSKSF